MEQEQWNVLSDHTELQGKDSSAVRRMLFEKVDEIEAIPISFDSMMNLKYMLGKRQPDKGEIVNAIERDPSLTLQILKLFVLQPGSIGTPAEALDQAVDLLGFDKLREVILSLPVSKEETEFEKKYWEHAFSTAQLMENFLKENELDLGEDIILACLLHDLGNLVLKQFLDKLYEMSLKQTTKIRRPWYLVQKRLMHVNHAEMGGILLSKWGMPETVFKPVLHHHLECEHVRDAPADFVLETALLQFVNHVDDMVRGIYTFPPPEMLLRAAGVEEIDTDYWLGYQQDLVKKLRLEKEKKKQVQRKRKTDTATQLIPRGAFTNSKKVEDDALSEHKKRVADELFKK